jgi:hypothetical protein
MRAKHCRIQYRRDRTNREGDYRLALSRSERSRSDDCRYGLAIPVAEAAEHRQKDDAALVHSFRELVERWKNDTGHWSSTTRRIADPSYLRIIGLARKSTGHQLEKLLLLELQNEPDEWFDALAAITGADPVKPEHNFDEAINAWVEWGRKEGII